MMSRRFRAILIVVAFGVALAIFTDVISQFIAFGRGYAPDVPKAERFAFNNGWGFIERHLAYEYAELHFFDWPTPLQETDTPESIKSWPLKRSLDGSKSHCCRIRAGFPFRSTEAVFEYHLPLSFLPAAPKPWESRPFVLRESDWRNNARLWMLVWNPRIGPFVANVLFYSGVFGLLWLGAAQSVRAWRLRRSKCEKCGYDLASIASGTCPECGNKSVATRSLQ